MKDKFGWLALLIFLISCWIIGTNRYLMKSLNITIVVMLLISILLVVLLNKKNKDN